MTFTAYLFVVSAIVFWGGMFAVKKESHNDGSYIAIFLAANIMTLSGIVLAFNELGITF